MTEIALQSSYEFIYSVTARNARISPSIKETPGETAKRIERFRIGEVNLLIATSVIEEVGQKSLDESLSFCDYVTTWCFHPLFFLTGQGFRRPRG